ncbi:queuosine precursor transporter [Pseudahrensia aquimaris]|uniref:Probable queuosine precursor transporter n=1 Tax=Pseudahrensia aquimaris TaxID=744461 RepID=A0ABW3FF86_9HYPH
MTAAVSRSTLVAFIAAMAFVVVVSNVLVQFPVQAMIGSYNLADLLTYGAFTYPIAFLVNDLTNRRFGPSKARIVVGFGFVLAVICSATIPPLLFSLGLFPFEMTSGRLLRIAIASGTAFLIAQLLDVFVFDRLRGGQWWKAPLFSTFVGSVLDTVLFFSLAFATSFAFLGAGDEFATEAAPFLGLFAIEAPRWISWAVGDFGVKVLVGLALLIPYGVIARRPAVA